MDGEVYRVKTTLLENKDSKFGNNQYTYEVTNVEVLNKKSSSTSNGVDKFSSHKEELSYPLAKLLKGVEKSYEKGKYILDESKKNDEKIRLQEVGKNIKKTSHS